MDEIWKLLCFLLILRRSCFGLFQISEFAFGHGQTTKNFVSYLYQGSVFSVEVLQINSSGVVEGVAMYVPVVSYGYKQGEKYSKSAGNLEIQIAF